MGTAFLRNGERHPLLDDPGMPDVVLSTVAVRRHGFEASRSPDITITTIQVRIAQTRIGGPMESTSGLDPHVQSIRLQYGRGPAYATIHGS